MENLNEPYLIHQTRRDDLFRRMLAFLRHMDFYGLTRDLNATDLIELESIIKEGEVVEKGDA